MIKFLLEVTHRGITAEHYMDGKKYMVWMYKDTPTDRFKFLSDYQVRGINKPLTKEDLIVHIDKYIEDCKKERERRERENFSDIKSDL